MSAVVHRVLFISFDDARAETSKPLLPSVIFHDIDLNPTSIAFLPFGPKVIFSAELTHVHFPVLS